MKNSNRKLKEVFGAMKGSDFSNKYLLYKARFSADKKVRRIARLLMAMDSIIEENEMEKDGGKGSGNFGHAGRPGKIGGSAESSVSVHENEKGDIEYEMPHIPVKVNGPQSTRKFIDDYVKKNPEIKKEIPKYMHVRGMVANFGKEHPDAEVGTYSATTGKLRTDLKGICVTFHQNLTEDDTLGGYTDEEYAAMCAITKKELGADDVNIGYYGNPEISFTCSSINRARKFAIQHNQKSIYDPSRDKCEYNVRYDEKANPIGE